MKRTWIFFLLLMTAAVGARASWVYHAKLANETALAANNAYTLDLSSAGSKEGIDRITAQAVYEITGSTTTYATSGSVGLVWLQSNDGVNFTAFGSSVTYTLAASTTTPTSTLWDFGDVGYRYIKLSVTKPSGGTLGLVVTVYGKN